MTTEQRLERLERENRWMRRGGAVALAAIAVVVLVAQEKGAIGDLEGSGLLLRDRSGQLRVVMRADLDGRTFASFCDSRGESRVSLAVFDKGDAAFSIGAKKAEQRLTIGVLADGDPFVVLRDARGNQRAKLSLLGGAPRIRLKDKDDKVIWKAPKD